MKQFTHHHYNPDLKNFARELRSVNGTRAEKKLWKAILSKKQTNERFLRQRPILNFIVDFFAPDIALIIEIDGNSHLDKGDYDHYRQNKLIENGYTVIRFTEGEVIQDLDTVELRIRHAIHALRSQKQF